MKLDNLNIKELNIVADEIDKLQFNIKTNINTNSNTMSKSEIKAMKALRMLLKKKSFSIREKAIEKRNKSKKDNVNVAERFLTIKSDKNLYVRDHHDATCRPMPMNEIELDKEDPRLRSGITRYNDETYQVKIFTSKHIIKLPVMKQLSVCRIIMKNLENAFKDPNERLLTL